jgi:integrase
MVRALVYSQLYRAVAGHQASSGSSEDQAHGARWRFRSRTLSQKLMRHSDIRTTLNVYGDVVTDEMAQAHSKVVRLAIPRPS